MNKKKTVFSAMQPSGNLTIGNYISVLRHWKGLQKKYKCIFCIADLHSLTSVTSNKNCSSIKKSILDTLALYLSCGVDPKKSIIFIQSSISEHAELNWILSCYTSYKELMRMTQFKSKILDLKKNINTGLFNYPVLMASDILLYKTDKVLVGEDQKQHIELTRNISMKFNSIYGKTFQVPKILIFQKGARIMSLLNPKKKMSKSDSNLKNSIFLLDNPKDILKKVKSSITDSDFPPKIFFDIDKKPGISNLLIILSTLNNVSVCDLEKYFLGKSYLELKQEVYNALIKNIIQIQEKFFFYRNNKFLLKEIFYKGSQRASKIAKKTLSNIYKILGLLKKFE
ncbi:tryptophan--tRNA ligase [Buchnera aphidicola]|uniref:tryptophan--tRNA ligase n=1 Tax=Buchnera aphidicola TaxID=9 RepID=UPI002093A94F|nr:tryptophan--tRNA ligase [Buchnera aphidicola]USS94094.1 tryptophan--tRNA ligase [Buchnera aphidicola (Sipha maydis)]WII23639.1 tryptophan--tRNA ligase [Buchnera aphidicola (Sipha maydis)]